MNRNQKIIIGVLVFLVVLIIVVDVVVVRQKQQAQKTAAAQVNALQSIVQDLNQKNANQPVDPEAAKKNAQFIQDFNAHSK